LRRNSRPLAFAAAIAGALAGTILTSFAAGALHAAPRDPPARAATRPVYKDASRPVELRVEDLLARMTLEEKVAQLLTVGATTRDVLGEGQRFDPARAATLWKDGIGQMRRVVEPGAFRIMAGNSSAALQSAMLTIED
jgi:beta-glucosidase